MFSKKILILAIFSIGLTGCGGTDSSDPLNTNGDLTDAGNDLLSSDGTYDFRDFFPTQNVTNTYDSYYKSSLSDEEYAFNSQRTLATTMTDTGFEVVYSGGSKNVYKVSSEKLNYENVGESNTAEIIRNFRLNDVTDKSDDGSYKCVADSIDTTKTFKVNSNSYTFNDVLTLKCTDTGDNYTDIMYYYMAKDKGDIGSLDKDCNDESGNINDTLTTCASGSESLEVLVASE